MSDPDPAQEESAPREPVVPKQVVEELAPDRQPNGHDGHVLNTNKELT